MIVEDERIIAQDMQQLLVMEGYEVQAIEDSAEQTIAAIKREKPDLVLIDIHLIGKMDGIKLSEEISKIEKIPIIYVTAYTDKKVIDRAMKTKPIAYIMKPIMDENLLDAVRIALK